MAGADPSLLGEVAAPDDVWQGLPDVGDVIDQKYKVEKRIGAGGMGAVVAVRHLRLGERYAIKCLRLRGSLDPQMSARFMLEARAAVRIRSEHIARVADVGQLPNGTPYILMEHLAGSDLASFLHRVGPLPITDAVDCVLQACEGVAEAHALGIVHRDLKPSNLFLTERSDGAPLVKVLDFGIAKALHDGRAEDSVMTDTLAPLGSPAYMSPEQIRSAKHVDFRTDVWGLGVILHELLSGTRPFSADTPLAALAAITADEPNDLRARRPEVGPALDAVIRRCLEKDVEKRFQSVADLAEALVPFSSGNFVSMGRIKRLSRTPTAEKGPLQGLAANAMAGRAVDDAPTITSAGDFEPVSPRSTARRSVWLFALAVVVGGTAALLVWGRRTEPPVAAVVAPAVGEARPAPVEPVPPVVALPAPPPTSPIASSAKPPPRAHTHPSRSAAVPSAAPSRDPFETSH